MVHHATSTRNEADIHPRLQKASWKGSWLGRVIYPRALNASRSGRGQATLSDLETHKLESFL